MNFFKFVSLACFTFLSLTLFSQNRKQLDSMLFVLSKQTTEDTGKVSNLLRIAKGFNKINPDSSLICIQKAQIISENIKYDAGIAKSVESYGNYYANAGESQKALEYHKRAIELILKLNDPYTEARVLNLIASDYLNLNDYPSALDNFQKSAAIFINLKNWVSAGASLNNIAVLYMRQDNYDMVLKYLKEATTCYRQLNDSNNMHVTLANMASAFSMKKDYKNSLKYNRESLSLTHSKNSTNYFVGLMAIAIDLIELKEFDSVLVYLDQATIGFEKENNNYFLAEAYYTRARFYNELPDSLLGKFGIYLHDKSSRIISELEKAVHVIDENTEMSMKRDILQLLYTQYEENDVVNAYRLFKEYISLRDSINNEENKTGLLKLELKYEYEKKEAELKLQKERKDALSKRELDKQKLLRNGFLSGFTLVLIFASVFFLQRNRIQNEKSRSDELLLNILPSETANELKKYGTAEAKNFDEATVMFTDFKNFTQASERMSATELVREIHYCYSEFDKIITRYGLEKIKTIGDSYMCAGGLPLPDVLGAEKAVLAALDILDFMSTEMQRRKEKDEPFFEIRIGLHTGPVVAGIVGIKKFAYDIWGDTVNIASRMESSGESGKLNISGSTYKLVSAKFNCIARGKVEAKNLGMIDMYFVQKTI